MDKINFRPAVIEDLPTLYEFEQGIVTAERPFDSNLKEGDINYYDIKAMINAKDTEVLVALNAELLIASAYVKINRAKAYMKFDKYAYVGFMYVKPEYRGKGISLLMLEKLKLWAKSKELTEFRLGVYEENHIAVSAYQKFGFEKHLVQMRMSI